MIPVVRVKDGVKFDKIAPAGARILAAIWGACFFLGCDLWITCGTEAHPSDDPHTTGEAYDVRVSTFDGETLKRLILWLRNELGALFTVLYEVPLALTAGSPASGLETVNPVATGAHLHIQRRKNTIYPPT